MSHVIKVGNQTAREKQCDHGNKDDVGVKDLVPSPAQDVSGGVRVWCLTRCGEQQSCNQVFLGIYLLFSRRLVTACTLLCGIQSDLV